VAQEGGRVKVRIPAAILCMLMALGGSPERALSEPAGQTLGPGSAPGRPNRVDDLSGRINPSDRDYGTIFAARRRALVVNSIEDLYFWSNVVTLLVLCALALIVLFEWRAMDRREVIASCLIARLWNGRVSDRIEIERRTEQFNRLAAVHNARVEQTLVRSSRTAMKQEAASTDLRQAVDGLRERTPDVDSGGNRATADRDASVTRLKQRNLLLERQVEAMRNTETNLRKRLEDATIQLEHEQGRNRALNGA
jgi:hypothetical protein